MTGGEPKNGVLVLNRDRIGHILPPRAPMALIIGASCSSQSGLSEHARVHMPISNQISGMSGGVLKHGNLALTRDCVGIYSPQDRFRHKALGDSPTLLCLNRSKKRYGFRSFARVSKVKRFC